MDLSIFQAFSSMRAAEANMEMTREMVSLQSFQTLTNMVNQGQFKDMDEAIASYKSFKQTSR